MDVVLRGAQIVDGTGSPAFAADVGLDAGRIAAVGSLRSLPGVPELDLDGLTLAPGFVDVHTHLDAQVLWDPEITPSCWHGVTTVILGNCGFGLAPTRPEHRSLILRTFENTEAIPIDALHAGVTWSFETFPQYLSALERFPKRLNVGALLGHTPLRFFVMGESASRREADDDELSQMCDLVTEAMNAGAIGFATSKNDVHVGGDGLPVPSRAASGEELFRLAAVVDRAGHGVVTVAAGTAFPLEDIAVLARTIRRPVSWESVFTGYDARDNYGSAPSGTALELLRQSASLADNLWPQVSCRPVVMQVTLADPYPLITYCWSFAEVTALPVEERARRYADGAWRARARADIADRADIMWRRISVQETQLHHELIGVPLAELGAQRGVDPLDVMLDLGLAEDLGTRFRMVLMNDDEHELAQILTQEQLVLAGSDAGAHLSQLCDACFPSHLLAHWVREKRVLTLPQAVHLLTGHSAELYGLHDRGVIGEGAIADLVAFDADRVGVADLERVRDLPGDAERLIARSQGIEHVWVNGTPIRSHGNDVPGAYPGRVVRGRRAAAMRP